MKSFTLGLNFYAGHDTSIFAIFEDGSFYGLSQERVSRIKHDAMFPIDALHEMIRYKKIDPKMVESLDVGVATKSIEKLIFNEYIYEMSKDLRKMIQGDNQHLFIKDFINGKNRLNSSSKFSLIKSFLSNRYGRSYLYRYIVGKKLTIKEIILKHLKKIFPNAKISLKFYEHHLMHAYSTYYTSGFSESLILTFDGYGDGYFSKLYKVKDGEFFELGGSKNVFVENLKKYGCADRGYASIGNIYSVFTKLLGFTPNADEGKVEALAAFGDHNNYLYKELLNSILIDKKSLCIVLDSERLNLMFDKGYLEELFNTLSKESIAASVQRFSEEVILRYLKVVKSKYNIDKIALAGGVSANVIINMKIFQTLYKNIHITPAMGDDGISQGSSIASYLYKKPTLKSSFKFPTMPYFGSAYSKSEVEKTLKNFNLKYEYIGEEIYKIVAKMVVSKKIGGWFFNRSEFGPRALGNRSIIADVRDKNIQKIINKNIKNRPLFQPFCPSVLIDEKDRLFEESYDNKHMTIAFKLKKEFKEQIPGAVHVDLSSRVQFVSYEDNPIYYSLIKEVKNLTGFGVIINTSFNKHGRTMVLTPKDACVDFIDTNLDFMAIEGFLIQRD